MKKSESSAVILSPSFRKPNRSMLQKMNGATLGFVPNWLTCFLLLLAVLATAPLMGPAQANGSLDDVRWLLAKPDRLPLIVEKRRNDITAFYNSEQAQILWLGQERSGALTTAMESTRSEGLRPEDYPYEVLIEATRSLQGPVGPSEVAWVELLYTGHFLDFANDLRAGRVSPRVLYPDAYMPHNSIETVDALTRLAGSDSVASFITDFQPQDDTYRRLKSHLARLYDIQANGGFTYLEPGEDLSAGATSDQVPSLRQRLVEDNLLGETSDSDVFDKRLAFAVGQAHYRYGFDVSGDVTPELVRALNIPVDRRIEQVSNAMERIRWIPNEYSRLQLFINKGENEYLFLENGRVIQEGRAYANCPDRNYTNTATTIEAVTFHPTWQVPFEYVGQELLPRLQSDPEQVASEGYYLRRKGAEVPLNALPWKQASPRSIERFKDEFSVYLPSSEENPLGRYAYRLRREQRLSLFDLEDVPESETYCNPYLPKTAFGILDGFKVLEHIIEPRVFPREGIPDRISRGDTITFPARGGLMAVVSHQSVWVQRQGIIRFGHDPYLEDARLTAALAGRPKP